MMKSPILVADSHMTSNDVCLKQLIEFSGLRCRVVDVSKLDTELDQAAGQELCILTSTTTIDIWCRTFPDPTKALDRLLHRASSFFAFGFTPETPSYIAARLSEGALGAVRSLTEANLRYQVTSSEPEITREFSGLSFSGAQNAIDCVFVCGQNARGITPLITIEGMPFWVLVKKNLCTIFLLACSAVADIQEPVDGSIDVTRYFSRLLPAAMFLRWSFKSRCWHSKHRFANFIIDDPPLKRSYGYLNYRDLVSTMDKNGFASTIAFIPWNHRRTDNEVTQLFRERPDRLSLCVHGCDHTTAEFSSADLAVLNSRVQLASARMNSLHRQNGLQYSKAMVFPQGRFSTEALRALKANNYLAALNSSVWPENSAANRPLILADLLEPAVTRYGGFPVFLRRYPGRLEQFACDLFFGKPVLVVEHHTYLKDGGGHLAEFIARLNSIERLQWSGLHEIMTKSYLERETSNDITACRLYTNHHVIENHSEREQTFIATKVEVDDVPIQNVLIDGQAARFSVSGNVLTFTMRIPALSSMVANIVYRNVLPCVEPGRAFASRSRVWTRRMLSEFRDNVLCRSDLLLANARALHRGLSGRRAVGPNWQGPMSS
jgi:hypothetical protein